jgi:hypothetical protein
MTAKELIDLFSALLTPLIAILAVYIAWQQYRIQHKTFNGQMYERRHTVFKAFMSFFSEIMRDGRITYPRLAQFYAEASDADFLFRKSIADKREELHTRGIAMARCYEIMYPHDGSPGLPVGDERSKVAHEHNEHLTWFIAQIAETKRLFRTEMAT